MATHAQYRAVLGAIERASRQIVWETPMEKVAGFAGISEGWQAFTHPPDVMFHGLGLGRYGGALKVEAYCRFEELDAAEEARIAVGRALDLPAAAVRVVACADVIPHTAPGDAGGHASLHASGGYGTVGGIAADVNSNLLLAVSNNHVFADCNRAALNDPLVDFGGGYQFGGLHRFVPLLPQPMVNELDGAVGWIHQGAMTLSRPAGAVDPTIGMRVQKFGARTGHTWGTVRAIFATTMVPYPGVGPANFRRCLRIEGDAGPFSLPGDSGSLVLDARGAVAGIVFAGETSGRFSFANPVAALTSGLSITF